MKQKKLDTKGEVLHGSILMKYSNSNEIRVVTLTHGNGDYQGLEGGILGSGLSMDIEFQFGFITRYMK